MADGGPYRSDALVVVQTHVERAFCPWCAHSDRVAPLQCRSASHRSPWGESPFCEKVNPRGWCDAFEPSWLTRALRAFGRRRPLLVPVSDRDIKPDNSPRNSGSGSRGGNVSGGYQGSEHVDPRAVRPPASLSAVAPAPKPVSGRRAGM